MTPTDYAHKVKGNQARRLAKEDRDDLIPYFADKKRRERLKRAEDDRDDHQRRSW